MASRACHYDAFMGLIKSLRRRRATAASATASTRPIPGRPRSARLPRTAFAHRSSPRLRALRLRVDGLGDLFGGATCFQDRPPGRLAVERGVL